MHRERPRRPRNDQAQQGCPMGKTARRHAVSLNIPRACAYQNFHPRLLFQAPLRHHPPRPELPARLDYADDPHPLAHELDKSPPERPRKRPRIDYPQPPGSRRLPDSRIMGMPEHHHPRQRSLRPRNHADPRRGLPPRLRHFQQTRGRQNRPHQPRNPRRRGPPRNVEQSRQSHAGGTIKSQPRLDPRPFHRSHIRP